LIHLGIFILEGEGTVRSFVVFFRGEEKEGQGV